MDGKSIIGIVNGEKRDSVYSQFSEDRQGLYMLAFENEKIIYSAFDDKIIYFDNRVNFAEEKNLAKDETMSEKVMEKKNILIRYLSENVPDAIENDDFKKYPKSEGNYSYIYQDQIYCRKMEKILPNGYENKLLNT